MPIGASEESPVDTPDVVPRHVRSVLRKVRAEPEVWGAVQAREESVDYCVREQFQVVDPSEYSRIEELRAA